MLGREIPIDGVTGLMLRILALSKEDSLNLFGFHASIPHL